jgi:hypothetical protein
MSTGVIRTMNRLDLGAARRADEQQAVVIHEEVDREDVRSGDRQTTNSLAADLAPHR